MEILKKGRFFGEIKSYQDIYGLYFIEKYHKQQKLPKHKHDNGYFCYALQGFWTEVLARETRHCDKGILVYHQAGEVHHNYFHQPGASTFNIEITPEFLELFGVPSLPEGFVCRSTDDRNSFIKLYKQFVKKDITKNVIEDCLFPLWYTPPYKTAIPPLFLCIREKIDEDLEEKLTLQQLGKIFHLHPTHISRGFKQHFGETIVTYRNRKRLRSVIEYLKDPSFTIEDIALVHGFYDISHLSKSIKKLYGKPIGILKAEITRDSSNC